MAETEEDVQLDVKPTSQVDLEKRLEEDFALGTDVVTRGPLDPLYEDEEARGLQVEGNEVEEFKGTDPQYMNYAEDTHKPFPFEGVEGEAVERQLNQPPPEENVQQQEEESPEEPPTDEENSPGTF